MRPTWILIPLCAVLLAPARGHALPGDLDPTFGSGGRFFDAGDEFPFLGRQPDGKLVTGRSFSFDVKRLLPDGTLDPTFVSTLDTLSSQRRLPLRVTSSSISLTRDARFTARCIGPEAPVRGPTP